MDHATHFLPRKIQKHCTVKLLQVRNGTGKRNNKELATFSPDDNIRLKPVRRKEQMKHDEAIKHKERMSVQFITCILTIKSNS